MQVPLLDLKGQFAALKPEIMSAIEQLCDSQMFVLGAAVSKFEDEITEYCGAVGSCGVSSGSDALLLALMAEGIGAGDEVITTPFTFFATVGAIARVGAKPVFADIDPDTLCLSPEAAEKLIKPGITKAIVPVHVYGNPCDVDGFARLGEKYGVKIIYDAAHAFGATLNGKSITEYGDMSMFSFHPTKLFHSCEGGLLVFNDESLQRKLFDLRNFAIHSETECVDVGTNAKMNELQALMGLLCLKDIDKLLESRKAINAVYKKAFEGVDEVRYLDYSLNKAYCPILFKDFETRERVYVELKETYNVFARRYFYPLLTDFTPYAYGKETCPVAEDIARRVLTLPTYYGLAEEDVVEIAENVIAVIK